MNLAVQRVTILNTIFVASRKWFFSVAARNAPSRMSNHSVREMLGQRGIKPETLPPEEDIKKLERRVKSEEKKIESKSGRLPKD